MMDAIVNLILKGTKALVMALWALVILDLLSLSPLSTQFQFYILVLAGVVLLVHFIEYRVMKGMIMSKAKVKMSLIQTMAWGYVYWLPILLNNKSKLEG